MAIYHLEAKIVTRGEGRSACAASAYMNCARIYNDYDGIQHDYTRKHGLVWQNVFLPTMAPAEWKDREKLWNAVEEAEKTKDSRLAREFIVSLPVELSREEWIPLLTAFVQTNFVDMGMCADVAVHDTDGHNPHAHILLTVRPLTDDGKWQNKTEKEYLCVRNGEERGFTAKGFKAAQAEGWEKQYPYKVGKKKVYMAPSAAVAQGLERTSKNPKSTRYGRQNPISERWNSEAQLETWRSAWAEAVNRCLERAGRSERVDHRSHAERGIDEQPTITEGTAARAMERKGLISDRCELNRQIKADNALLRELKALVAKLTKAVQTSVTAIAHAMETIRQNIIVFNYGLLFVQNKRRDAKEYVSQATEKYNEYQDTRRQIKGKIDERKKLQKKLDALSLFSFGKRKELKTKIAELSEEIRERKVDERTIMRAFEKEDIAGMMEVEGEISKAAARIVKLDAQEVEFTGAIKREKGKFDELKEQAADLEQNELTDARLDLRPGMEREAHERVSKATHDGRVSIRNFQLSVKEADILLGKENLTVEHRRQRSIGKDQQCKRKLYEEGR